MRKPHFYPEIWQYQGGRRCAHARVTLGFKFQERTIEIFMIWVLKSFKKYPRVQIKCQNEAILT